MATSPNPNSKLAQPVYPIIRDDTGAVVHQTPEAFHPGFVKGDGPAAEQTRSNFREISQSLAVLNAKRVNLHPSYATDINQAFAHNGRLISEARQLTEGEIAQHEWVLGDATGFSKPDMAARAYIVGRFSEMRPEERVVAIDRLVEEGDGASLAILNSVSGVYSGLSNELRDTIKTRLFSKADPARFAQLQVAKANLARIEAASIENANACAKFSAPQHVARPADITPAKSVAG